LDDNLGLQRKLLDKTRVADPDLQGSTGFNLGKLEPDPEQSEKLDPDPDPH
jgi:hypothetical protein